MRWLFLATESVIQDYKMVMKLVNTFASHRLVFEKKRTILNENLAEFSG